VVLRHNRFAEVLIGDQRRIFFANRCVAFDTEPEQIQALWRTVLTDITTTENENRIKVEQVLCLNWLEAEPGPAWPDPWPDRLVEPRSISLTVGDTTYANSWPAALDWLSLRLSVSPLAEKVCYAAGKLVPAFNLALAVFAAAMIGAMLFFHVNNRRLAVELAAVEQQVHALNLEQPQPVKNTDFASLINFVGKIDQRRRLPEYRKIMADLGQEGIQGLTLEWLKIDFNGDQVGVALFGDIQAPFARAHDGYQQLIHRLKQRGYTIVENKFETQISRSKIMLKLTGPTG
jgi:hypothetical protein